MLLFVAIILQPYHHEDDEDEEDNDDDDGGGGGGGTSNAKRKKRSRVPNPDAELILQATEHNLRLLGNIDPNSKEGKKQRRKIRNRMSAQIHRNRKKVHRHSYIMTCHLSCP